MSAGPGPAVYSRYYCEDCGHYWTMVSCCKWSLSLCLGCRVSKVSLEIQEAERKDGQKRLL